MAGPGVDLVKIDITGGEERDKLRKSEDLRELLSRGWRPALSWLATVQAEINGQPVGPKKEEIHLVMLPPALTQVDTDPLERRAVTQERILMALTVLACLNLAALVVIAGLLWTT